MLIPRTVRAWSSWFGDLRGVADVAASRRLEVSPYVAAASTLYPGTMAGNPFTGGANLAGRIGADVKMGLGPNLTLEATINPDFGQVEADPAEVNLTAFETRFPNAGPSSSRARRSSTSATRTSTTRGGLARGRSARLSATTSTIRPAPRS